jgi:hypothetical protein
MTDQRPPYLNNTEPMEIEDVPLQVALLTGELAELRSRIVSLDHHLEMLSNQLNEMLTADANDA